MNGRNRWLHQLVVWPWTMDDGRWTLIVCLFMSGCAASNKLMAVNVAVGDLRAQPNTRSAAETRDPLQETQLLYGERVRVLKVQEGWAAVEAIEQPEFTHAKRWQGYPGWIPLSLLSPWDALRDPNIVIIQPWACGWHDPYKLTPSVWEFPLGTYLRATDMGGQLWKVELLDGEIVWVASTDAQALSALGALPPMEKRQMIVSRAQRMMGSRYYWGGRSPRLAAMRVSAEGTARLTGMDCSGLVNLAYRATGVRISRDAHEQFLRARPVATPQMADLIFLSERNHPQRIVHVMLYAGAGEVIEGPGTGFAVRRIAVVKRLGRAIETLAPGDVVDGQTIVFGSYLP